MSFKPFIFVLLLTINPAARNYYIDYLEGNDQKEGTANSPWKHSPGDKNASDNATQCILRPGDTVFFRGGVKYLGNIDISMSGIAENHIVFNGSEWGNGNAIIDGSEEITAAWEKCSSDSEVNGNPFWENIWYTDIYTSNKSSIGINLHEEDSMLAIAQYPKPNNRFYYENIDNYLTPQEITSKTITDNRLQELGGSSLVGKRVLVYGGNNLVRSSLITDYSLNKIYFENVTNPYTGNNARFSLFNNVLFIEKPGEYSFSETPDSNNMHRIFLYPLTQNPNQSSIYFSIRNFGINLNSCNYITIEGFTILRFSGDGSSPLGHLDGIGIGTISNGPVSNITIRNNTIRNNRFPDYGGYGGIYINNGTNLTIDNNIVKFGSRHRGIFLAECSDINIRNNYIENMGLTGISHYNCKRSLIEGNTIKDVNGGHANGMSLYLANDSILVIRNKIINSNICFAFNDGSNVWLYNNLFDGSNNTTYAAIFRSGSGTIGILNNTIINSDKSVSLLIQADANIILKNNILDGGGEEEHLSTQTDRNNNLYVGLAWRQAPRYGWEPEESEILNRHLDSYSALDPTDVFHNYEMGDYNLSVNSPAIGKGVPTDIYVPEFFKQKTDINIDLNGNIRPINNSWDIGAYEFTGKIPSAPLPLTGIRVK